MVDAEVVRSTVHSQNKEHHSMTETDYINPETCPECKRDTNKFIGKCDHCDHDRWEAADESSGDAQ